MNQTPVAAYSARPFQLLLRYAQVARTLFALLVIAAMSRYATAATIDANGFEVGGSNYPFYDVSTVPWNGVPWAQPLALRPVIGTLHYDPDRVLAQLTVMKSRGQKKISLVVWHMHFAAEVAAAHGDVFAHTIASNSAALTPQHQLNLRTLCNFILQLEFEEVQVRFAPQGATDPQQWTNGWQEGSYQENWNFLLSLRSEVEDVFAESAVRRVYDLGLELGGVPAGETLAYNRRLWSDYVYSFGTSDTCGFSINPRWGGLPGLVTANIHNLSLTGVRPNSYAFDIYGDEYVALQDIWLQLLAAGELSKSIVIQEAYYNDADTYQQVVLARNTFGLNIRAIMQWPQQRWEPATFTMTYTKEYRNYNPSSINGVIGVVDASSAVCTIPSNSSVCSPTITWTTDPATMSDIRLGGGQLFAQGTSGSQLAPWISPGHCPFYMTTTSGGLLLDQISVVGVEMKGKLKSSSASNTCQLQPGQDVCTMTIYWSVPDGWGESISVKMGDQLFATSGIAGSQEAPWISAEGATFRLYAGTKLLDELFVRAVP